VKAIRSGSCASWFEPQAESKFAHLALRIGSVR